MKTPLSCRCGTSPDAKGAELLIEAARVAAHDHRAVWTLKNRFHAICERLELYLVIGVLEARDAKLEMLTSVVRLLMCKKSTFPFLSIISRFDLFFLASPRFKLLFRPPLFPCLHRFNRRQ